MCWMSLCLLHFSISMSLFLSQSSGLICDPVAAVLKSATCTHTATGLENFWEWPSLFCFASLFYWDGPAVLYSLLVILPHFRQLLLHLNSK